MSDIKWELKVMEENNGLEHDSILRKALLELYERVEKLEEKERLSNPEGGTASDSDF